MDDTQCRMNDKTNQSPATIPCWNCEGTMKRIAHDIFYWFYKCPDCGKERAQPREDRRVYDEKTLDK